MSSPMYSYLPLEVHGLDQNPKRRHKSTSEEGSGCSTNTPLASVGHMVSDRIGLVSHNKMQALLAEHANQKLPYCDEVFPWLHGYSGSREPPRGLKWTAVIRSQPLSHGMIENSGLLKSSLDPHEFLIPWDHRKHCIESIIQDMMKSVSLTSEEHRLVLRACKYYKLLPFLVTDAGAQKLYGAGAAKHRVCSSSTSSDPPSSAGWRQPGMFRRFDLQVAKFIELSQMCVIYCLSESRHWEHCHCQDLALLLYVARRNVDLVGTFKINILDTLEIDPEWWGTPPMNVSSLKKEKSSQLASEFDVASFSNWDRDLFYRERLEISKMSGATCVSSETATWCGNSTDFEIYRLKKRSSSWDPPSSYSSDQELHQDLSTIVLLPPLIANDATNAPIDNKLFNFPRPSREWKLFIHCSESSSLPELPKITECLDIIQTEGTIPHTTISFPNSGSIGLGNLNLESIKVILNICYLIYRTGKFTEFGTLIYCSDGYTEVSFLLVAYLIYVWDAPLDQVLFKLHKESQRPFFLFPIDLQVLGHLQILLREESPKRKSITAPFLDVDPDLFSKMFFTKFHDEYHLSQLKGPLPSKVLPHLYLGALEHAQTPKLLCELNIKNIVSVGETMPWLLAAIKRRRSFTASEVDHRRGLGRPVLNTTASSSHVVGGTERNRRARGNASSIIEENGFRVLHIADLDDNGEDPLLSQLDVALKFIDECRQRDEKVLVHCMVGVSRSATVCIAECMRHLNCDLIRAYLYVRVRRLNIIIQPNLMFVYELCKWQESQGIPLAVDWHIICRSISELNRMYF
ncbi:LADA_0E01310g1_1 [Lachancea dasiensis]|uniref:LADA_0E01310g1_1 n=1 Tax=Lachancea dasiensis TaxID=1072105 RepID=A0A1G4JAY7_9SACH|nr:LADA_0E01310g1_1 [Lachancea dasiensis]